MRHQCGLIVCVLFGSGVLAAQAPRAASLGSAEARAKQPLSLVTTIRETVGGMVFVADPIERKLLLFDPALQSGKALGREGGGPGEYRQPDAVWPFRGDSVLVLDLGNARLAVVSGTGTWGRSMPLTGGGDGPPVPIFPGGTDANGNIYFAPRLAGPGDSVSLMRVNALGAQGAPVARLKTPDVDRQESGDENSRSVQIRPIPLAASDGFAVSPTGAVAVIRTGDYHVEWLSQGAVKRGAPVAVPKVSIGQKEKREWVNQQMLAGGVSVSVSEENGNRTVEFGRQRPQKEPSTEGYKWPAAKAPFEAGSVRIDGQGRVWVRRSRAAGEPPMFDVFDANGALAGTVNFPLGRVLLGFGAKGLYAAHVDEDGTYTLERYKLPL